MHSHSHVKLFTYPTTHADSNKTVIFQKTSLSSQLLTFSTFESSMMSRAEVQESAEYYKWLLCIERAEFEKELLEIVSSRIC